MTDVPPASRPRDPAGPAFTADEVARITGGRLLTRSDRPIRGAAVDSRVVADGEVFVALPGERTDGHAFVDAAVARGASAVIVTRNPADLASLGEVSVVRVGDALAALHALAAAWRSRFDPLVVGVTGSIAKTSTKEAIAAVLSARLRVLKNEGNQNNEVGLPLTVLRMAPEHEAAVLEMGMYAGGEIADLAAIARPRIGVVTAIQPVHLSRMGSLDAIEQAKGELLEALPQDGTAILNADDARVRGMGHRTSARSVTYGFAADADVAAEGVASAGVDGMRFVLRTAAGRRAIEVPTLGRLAVHNALAGAAVGLAAGLSLDDIAAGLARGWAAPHRAQLVRAGGATIVDDSYNASPASVLAALELVAGLPGRKVAVLGEMLELGEGHESGHRSTGEEAARVVELLIVVGRGAAAIAAGAREAGLAADRVIEVPDRDAARDALRPRVRDGDVILVKASRGVELDLLVDALRTDLGGAPGPASVGGSATGVVVS
ncbi:MAG TPA: UDP-N-acetylmuramoyl-tripeptide--D-alanyl-D-alanine ligase [Candidatus Limnocylindrales bacterium]